MLEIQDFFSACVVTWKTERTYHYPLHNEVERSYTEFNVGTLASAEKSQISSSFLPTGSISDPSEIDRFPGFTIGFNTVSEKGDSPEERLCLRQASPTPTSVDESQSSIRP